MRTDQGTSDGGRAMGRYAPIVALLQEAIDRLVAMDAPPELTARVQEALDQVEQHAGR